MEKILKNIISTEKISCNGVNGKCKSVDAIVYLIKVNSVKRSDYFEVKCPRKINLTPNNIRCFCGELPFSPDTTHAGAVSYKCPYLT
jgi:hypothetical protein